jgi:hypothetical protein
LPKKLLLNFNAMKEHLNLEIYRWRVVDIWSALDNAEARFQHTDDSSEQEFGMGAAAGPQESKSITV